MMIDPEKDLATAAAIKARVSKKKWEGLVKGSRAVTKMMIGKKAFRLVDQMVGDVGVVAISFLIARKAVEKGSPIAADLAAALEIAERFNNRETLQ